MMESTKTKTKTKITSPASICIDLSTYARPPCLPKTDWVISYRKYALKTPSYQATSPPSSHPPILVAAQLMAALRTRIFAALVKVLTRPSSHLESS